MYEIVSLGELLIDLIPHNDYTSEAPSYEAKVGGAPVNVLSGLAKWGHTTAYISKVGNDAFGAYLKKQVKGANIHADSVLTDAAASTTVAIVSLDENKNRTFDFIRNPGADQLLTKDEINGSLIREAKLFHFGSLSLTHNPSREATLEALRVAKENHNIICYDPNYRPLLWDNQDEAKRWMVEGLKWADIVKISDEEVQFITNEEDTLMASQVLAETHHIPLLFMTKGKEGALAVCNGHVLEEEGHAVQPVDTTGAGDCFMASVLHQYLDKNKPIRELTKRDLTDILQFANRVAAHSTTIKGGFSVVPTLEELEKITRGVQHV
ncbi:carbohydrate kinase [Neobacillus drentensis]|uniref:carbohydrate kinase family protein n=1 Tax=Neobacillus drentensis TaxID=220684 RepID=UPI001F1668D0|nr:carbohydrate kinase [Neobacillus drentensis]ULT56640.1 carbohydrate kinase [Neobacillus drentensis]